MKKVSLISILLVGSILVAQAKTNVFVESELISHELPDYPYSQRRENSSGAVQLIFMVNKEGKPFEIMVANSSLNAFTVVTVPALKKYRYEPATLNGKPVESRQTLRVKFRIDKQKQGASADFTRYYKKLKTELERENPENKRATKFIRKMEKASVKNLYALTYSGLAWLEYSMHFGTADDKIDALKDIVLFDIEEEKEHKVLSKAASISVMGNLLELLINTGRYGEALSYYKRLQPKSEKISTTFSDAITQIKNIQTSDASFIREITINNDGFVQLNLFKRSFQIEPIQGKIDTLKFRCDTKYFEVAFSVDASYQIPESWGQCNLQVLGPPGTSAKLLQI